MNSNFQLMGKEAVLYEEIQGGRIRCTACNRYCLLKDGQTGFCGIRKNVGGKLYLLSYGLTMSDNVDPIEKKPLYHYFPGSYVLSISTTGCNWMCKYCQNYDISQRRKVDGMTLLPEAAQRILRNKYIDGVSYTYNEPTIFAEYAHDIGVKAKELGKFNLFVSNGYMSKESIPYIREFLDAITVDFKGNGNDMFARKYIGIETYKPVFENLKLLKELGTHVEITDLVVPVKDLGDKEEDVRFLSQWIYKNLGDEVPLHFTRFHPDYLMMDVDPTPVEMLERFHKIAKDEGLKYVYTGNVPGHPLENTYCPRCGFKVIERRGFYVSDIRLTDENMCPRCGEKIDIVGKAKLSKDKYWEWV